MQALRAAGILVMLGVVGTVLATAAPADRPSVAGLLTEFRENPLGVDSRRPEFSWRMMSGGRGARQTAYQIQVASSEALLRAGKSDIWDSGKAASSRCIGIPYEGCDLQSRTAYCWRVRIWDENGTASVYSKPASFEMALLDSNEWQGRWITTPGGGTGTSRLLGGSSPMLRTEFTLDKPVARARAYVTGLGYYELRLNGKKVGDRVLDPANASFDKRVYYSTYDVTKLLARGCNCAAALLGQGWWRDSPRLLLQLDVTFTDGTASSIVTDERWRWTQSPILESSVYDGEAYDARMELPGWDMPGFDDSGWKPVDMTDMPGSTLSAQMIQPIEVIETLTPENMTSPKPGVYVLDFGQNFSGWCRLEVSGKRGTKVTLRHAELIYPDGTVNQEDLRTAKATDIYILSGKGAEVYEPRFTYHGFRYVQVEGFPGKPSLGSIRGRVVHTALEPQGKFECSDKLINRIHHNAQWGGRTNFHSIPTDCCQRDERMGWLADAHLSSYSMLYNFNMAPAYAKFLRDIQDAQGEDGRIPDCVPQYWGGSNPGDPMWAAAYPIITWDLYRHTGDVRLLEEHYDGIKRNLEMLCREAQDYVLTRNLYGDWLRPVETPGPVIAQGSFCLTAQIAAKMAEVLGRQDEAERYRELSQRIAEAFNAQLFDPKTCQYSSGSQFSNALPLYLGIVPPEHRQAVIDNLGRNILAEREGHLSTGLVGTRFLMDTLVKEGRADVAYTIVTQETYPGWGYMIANGATTMWEWWSLKTGNNMNSHNHAPQTFISGWFYAALAGLVPDEKHPGWEHFSVKPHVVGDLKWAKGTVQTLRGKVESRWRRTDRGVRLDVTVPANSQATVYVPKGGASQCGVKEGGKVIWRGGRFVPGVDGITSGRDDGEWIGFEVGSGEYSFESAGIE